MAIEIHHTSTVLIGRWNPAIVVPPWLVSQNIVEGKADSSVQGRIGGQGELLFSLGGMRWEVSESRLVIKSEDGANTGLVAKAVLDRLRHTPVQAIGTNFAFRLTPDHYPAEMIPCLGSIRVPDEGTDSPIRKVQTQVSKATGDNSACHITVNHAQDMIIVAYNYHINVSSAEEAANLAEQWQVDRDSTVVDLRKTFGLEFKWPQR
jgi:hypothetical protein